MILPRFYRDKSSTSKDNASLAFVILPDYKLILLKLGGKRSIIKFNSSKQKKLCQL